MSVGETFFEELQPAKETCRETQDCSLRRAQYLRLSVLKPLRSEARSGEPGRNRTFNQQIRSSPSAWSARVQPSEFLRKSTRLNVQQRPVILPASIRVWFKCVGQKPAHVGRRRSLAARRIGRRRGHRHRGRSPLCHLAPADRAARFERAIARLYRRCPLAFVGERLFEVTDALLQHDDEALCVQLQLRCPHPGAA